jgi:hypothetical protein
LQVNGHLPSAVPTVAVAELKFRERRRAPRAQRRASRRRNSGGGTITFGEKSTGGHKRRAAR